jgi:hypothetical protein
MDEQNNSLQQSQEQKTNSEKILSAIKKHKKLYYKTLPIAFIAACLITLGMPNYYKCEVTLAPESGGGSSFSGLASLASSFGFNIGSSSNKSGDAITPNLYPDLMASVNFRTSMFNVKVKMENDDRVMTYYDYLDNEQKSPWWTIGLRAFFGLFKSNDDKEQKPGQKDSVNIFRLTPDQQSIANSIAGSIECKIDKKTDVISIVVTDQDPLVAATIADSVKERLQYFLTEYRTKKARHDLAYIETLYKEARKNYDCACDIYAEFMDANQDLVLESVRLKQTKLENEMQLQYNNFNAIGAQLLAAKAKVQEETPAFTTLQSATVPLRKAGPKRSRIVLIFVLLVFLCTTGWILYKEGELMFLLGLDKKKKELTNA